MSTMDPLRSAFPFQIASKGLEIVDNTLHTASFYAEKVNHITRPVSLTTPYLQDDAELHSSVAKAIELVRLQIKNGLPISISLQNAAALVNALAAPVFGGLDDRKMLLEYVLTFLSRIPSKSILARDLQDKVITLLYNDLVHPPSTMLGKSYRFRSADGSGNSIWKPDMGKAGSHYARSVQGLHPLPPCDLPAPELLFDTLLKREKQVDHPSGLSSLFFAFANLIIHSLFMTDHTHPQEGINKTSSYLDLSIIYGNNQVEQNSVRLLDGTGRLHPDTFADSRLLRMPPSTPAMCVLFSRNHNHIATKLLAVNERQSWKAKVGELDSAARKKQDEEIFQTARLINCGWFMNVILSDYLAAILGLVREGNSWSLNPLEFFRTSDHTIAEAGQGNVVAIEFAAMYHFHATVSTVDEAWAARSMKELFNGKAFDDITEYEYIETISNLSTTNPLPPPKDRTFANLKRSEDGSFRDKDLAQLLQSATETVAGAFGARRTPHALRIVEIMAIQENRKYGTCSLNEYRKFLGLKPYRTFEEWNPRPDVAQAARALYEHPDRIELYVGLQAEETKPPMPGAGLCPGFTSSRAILADAVCLVRGDRFLTTDMTSFNLTAWGYADCQRDPTNPAFGGMLGSLLMRTLPNDYNADSMYTQFPLMTPNAMRGYLSNVGIANKYSFNRPISSSPIKAIQSYADAYAVLSNTTSFSAPYPSRSQDLQTGYGYLATFNHPDQNLLDIQMIRKAFAGSGGTVQHAKWLETTSAQLIRDKSYTLPGSSLKHVDIIKDVINPLGVQFASTFVLGLPLKTERQPIGTYLEPQVYAKLRSIYDYIFVDNAGASKIALRDQANDNVKELVAQVMRHFRGVGGSIIPFVGLIDTAVHLLTGDPGLSHPWLQRLLQSGRGRDELSYDAVVLSSLVAVEFSQALVHVLDVLLDDTTRPSFVLLAKDDFGTTPLKAVILEALRLAPPLPGVCRDVLTNVSIGSQTFSAGDRVFVSLVDANYDPAAFDNPTSIIPNRANMPLLGDGLHRLLGEDWILTTMTPVIRNILSLGNVSRGSGPSGHLSSLKSEIPGGTKIREYLSRDQHTSSLAHSLLLNHTHAAPVIRSPYDIPSGRTPELKPTSLPGSIPAIDEAPTTKPTKPAPASGEDDPAPQPSPVPSVPDYRPEFIGGVGGGQGSVAGGGSDSKDPEPGSIPNGSDPTTTDDEEPYSGYNDPIWTPSPIGGPNSNIPATVSTPVAHSDSNPDGAKSGQDLVSKPEPYSGYDDPIWTPSPIGGSSSNIPTTVATPVDQPGSLVGDSNPDEAKSGKDPVSKPEPYSGYDDPIWMPSPIGGSSSNIPATVATPVDQPGSLIDDSPLGGANGGQDPIWKPSILGQDQGGAPSSGGAPADSSLAAPPGGSEVKVEPVAVVDQPRPETTDRPSPTGAAKPSLGAQQDQVVVSPPSKGPDSVDDSIIKPEQPPQVLATLEPKEPLSTPLPQPQPQSQPQAPSDPDPPVQSKPDPVAAATPAATPAPVPAPANLPAGFDHTEPAGNQTKGTPWDDYKNVDNATTATIMAIKVWHDTAGIHAIQVCYTGNKWAPSHGTPGKFRQDVMYLQRNEKIVKVDGRQSGIAVTGLQLFTNTGRTSLKFGSDDGEAFSRAATGVQALRYFSGTADTDLNALQAHFA